jgi:7-carboxy-7-deazaguanine synthase
MTVDEIIGEVTRYPSLHVVLTGGEPMVAPGMADLAAGLKLLGRHVTIETAATVAPAGIACDLASLSPKLLNSAPDRLEHAAWRRKHEALRWRPEVVRAWLDAGPWQLKFVVAQPADVEEIEGMLAQLRCDVPRHKVLLMPEGTTTESLRARAPWLSALCKQRGFRYAHRLQIELYGNTRGT